MRALAGAILSAACLLPWTVAMPAQGDVEDIYVVRSLRLSRAAATGFCAEARTGMTGFNLEDRYDFQSLATDAASGAVTDAGVATVGSLHACFGPTFEPARFAFYAEGALNGVPFTGRGDCVLARQNFPEEGLRLFRCFLDLSGLQEPYAGGHLTTNSITSRQDIGAASDPPGYVQPSIATVRLWKKRR